MVSGIGVLAYGSLIRDPGPGLSPLIARRTPTTTPFPVEYARLSRTRGGAPTIVPHPQGGHVRAELIALAESVSLQEAKSRLWRRETRREESSEDYRDSQSPNAVLVRDHGAYGGLNNVLYTDFNPAGKLDAPNAEALARAAIGSVANAPAGKDGISYLKDLLDDGVVTPLTASYRDQILALTGCSSLSGALGSLNCGTPATEPGLGRAHNEALLAELFATAARASVWRIPAGPGAYLVLLNRRESLSKVPVPPSGALYLGISDNLSARCQDTHFATAQTGFSTLRRSLGAILRNDD